MKKVFLTTVILLVFFVGHSQGANAPEAGSFEPVDATDMVNLLTGDLTYVLPLLNVPSPEGGYPIALTYHAGIAMDQEASWVGLGWNLNPGAINRNINGYPDDYSFSKIEEYFYDKGGEETVNSISLGYSNGLMSVGYASSWGSNQSLSGTVSIGIGAGPIGLNVNGGSNGFSGGLGIQLASGLSLGANVNSNGNIGGTIGFGASNGTGFSIGASSGGSFSAGITTNSKNDNLFSLGIDFNSSGVGVNGKVTNLSSKSVNGTNNYSVDGGAGIGISTNHNSSVQMNDYVTKSSGFMIPIVAPTPIGVFSLTFGQQKFEYSLSKYINNNVSGPLHFHLIHDFNTDAFMDIYEVSIENNSLSENVSVELNNITFPSFDNYQLQAQGLSGNIRIGIQENGALFGLSDRKNSNNSTLYYGFDNNPNDNSIPAHSEFNFKPEFYFENEIGTFLQVSKATFNTNNNNFYIVGHYETGVNDVNAQRRIVSNYIQYFTNGGLISNPPNNFLQPNATGFDRANKPSNGVGGFRVISKDGKIYHYSLPVYNHEIITRKFGHIPANQNENQAYIEKRQLESYATHWLLTAITGPDFIDMNNNGRPDESDYGYWVEFEYGKWSDGFVWKNPYGKEYIEHDADTPTLDRSKTWVRGRKELYYLDAVKTRTHTALFIKEERQDARSEAWDYSSVSHVDGLAQSENDYISRFVIPSQNQLGLSKIILLKNEDHEITKDSGNSNHLSENIKYNNSTKPLEIAWFNLKNNVYDISDNWLGSINNAIKVIDLEKDYSLVNGSPNAISGRSTLKSVKFSGKSGVSVLPPYDFKYINNPNYTFNIKDQDQYGYLTNSNSMWSLNEITTPEGSTIGIEYESKKFKSAIQTNLKFVTGDVINSVKMHKFKADIQSINSASGLFTIECDENYGFAIGDNWLEILYTEEDCDGQQITTSEYTGTGTIIQDLSSNSKFKYLVQSNNIQVTTSTYPSDCGNGQYTGYEILAIDYEVLNPVTSGGVVTSKISVSDLNTTYSTEYNYGINDDNVGLVSYIPYAPHILSEVPYSNELPSPRVMFEEVNVVSTDALGNSTGKTRYKFNVLGLKSANEIKFGDFFEITSSGSNFYNSNRNKDVFIRDFIVKNNLASIGQLLEVSQFNKENQLISSVKNVYYSPEETPNLEGVVEESYQTYKSVNYDSNTTNDRWVIASITKKRYPNLLKQTLTTNNIGTFTTNFSNIDTTSGAHLESLTEDSFGNSLKTLSKPAYQVYPDMGPTLYFPFLKKNMLTQEAASYTFIKEGSTWKPIGVGITTWNNNWNYIDREGNISSPANSDHKVWRKHKQFIWDGNIDANGVLIGYDVATDDGFNWSIDTNPSPESDIPQPTQWKEVSETNYYDHYSMPLEVEGIDSIKVSTKMWDNDGKVSVTGNAGYGEVFYSSAENIELENGVHYIGQGIKATGEHHHNQKSHTGDFSKRVYTGGHAFTTILQANQHRPGKYKLSVWVDIDNYTNARIVHNGNQAIPFEGEKVVAGNWVQLNHYLDLTSGFEEVYLTSINGDIYFDDFRLHPIESSVTSYVYNEYDELTFILGLNNMATKYQYDTAGRLIKVFQETANTPTIEGGFKRAKEYRYNYKRQ